MVPITRSAKGFCTGSGVVRLARRCLNPLSKRSAEDAVAIVDEEPGRRVVGKASTTCCAVQAG